MQTNLKIPKGQLISKFIFGIFNFLKKTNEKIRIYYYGTSSRIVFVSFLGESKTPKRLFEINWPLVVSELVVCRKIDKEVFGASMLYIHELVLVQIVSALV